MLMCYFFPSELSFTFFLGSSPVDFGLTVRGVFGPETGVSAAPAQQTVPAITQGFAGELKYLQFSNSL